MKGIQETQRKAKTKTSLVPTYEYSVFIALLINLHLTVTNKMKRDHFYLKIK